MQVHNYGKYHGERKPLFFLALKTTLLTILTLGIYRFWAKTRIRKHFWSSTSFGEDSFEYTGTGLEKFLGFLVAVIVLAIYLGIVQMVLFFFGLNFIVDAQTPQEELMQVASIYLTLFAALPIFLFAQYRVRRYKLARTRYRGIRFGMENGAWGYAFRALGHYFLTMITLGILLPRQTFYLEKYMSDRMWYGDQQFTQAGEWKKLYRGLKHVLIGLLICIGAVVGLAAFHSGFFMFVVLLVGYLWAIVGFYFYTIYSFNYLTTHKTLGEKITFDSAAEPSSVVKTMIGGTLLSVLVGGLILAISGGIAFSLIKAAMAGGTDPYGSLALVYTILPFISLLFYILGLMIISVLMLVFVTQPVIEKLVNGLKISGVQELDNIRQREADTGADAEGFAEALDIGGAI